MEDAKASGSIGGVQKPIADRVMLGTTLLDAIMMFVVWGNLAAVGTVFALMAIRGVTNAFVSLRFPLSRTSVPLMYVLNALITFAIGYVVRWDDEFIVALCFASMAGDIFIAGTRLSFLSYLFVIGAAIDGFAAGRSPTD